MRTWRRTGQWLLLVFGLAACGPEDLQEGLEEEGEDDAVVAEGSELALAATNAPGPSYFVCTIRSEMMAGFPIEGVARIQCTTSSATPAMKYTTEMYRKAPGKNARVVEKASGLINPRRGNWKGRVGRLYHHGTGAHTLYEYYTVSQLWARDPQGVYKGYGWHKSHSIYMHRF